MNIYVSFILKNEPQNYWDDLIHLWAVQVLTADVIISAY